MTRGGLHEIFAATMMDEPSAAAFTITLALRASNEKPIVWVRQDFVGLEMGEVYAPGLNELGLSPDRLILVQARDGPDVLRAAEEAARCSSVGAVVVEPWGNPKTLNLVATRRLSLASMRSEVPLLMMRAGGAPIPSAATTRWNVGAAHSTCLEAEAPGNPAFTVSLLRDRSSAPGRKWVVEWDRDRRVFKDISSAPSTTLSGGMVSLPVSRLPEARAGTG